MHKRNWCLALLICVVGIPNATAQTRDDKPKAKEPASLQQQIDDLKAGQQQILKELQEIRKILQGFQDAANQQPPQDISLPVTGEPFKGSPAAHVAIIEYSDFQCPFCGGYAREVFPKIDSEYIKNGKIRYYFRDLPLPMHSNAMQAAQAARCAGDEGKFWEMHALLFSHQDALDAASLKKQAETIGVDPARFAECLTSGKYRNNVARSVATAERMRIDGTPAFLIGVTDEKGEQLKVTQVLFGAKPFEEFKTVLDAALAPPAK
jgi:protein-disulfide isomerase